MAKIIDCYSYSMQVKSACSMCCARHAPNVTKMLSFIFIEKFAWNFYFHKYHRPIALSVCVCVYVNIAWVFLWLVFFSSFKPACNSIELNHLSGECIALVYTFDWIQFWFFFRIFVEKNEIITTEWTRDEIPANFKSFAPLAIVWL